MQTLGVAEYKWEISLLQKFYNRIYSGNCWELQQAAEHNYNQFYYILHFKRILCLEFKIICPPIQIRSKQPGSLWELAQQNKSELGRWIRPRDNALH